MALERYIRLIAGTFILGSLALGQWVSSYWYLVTAFAGANLMQSAVTRWWLMEHILRGLGVSQNRKEGLRNRGSIPGEIRGRNHE